MLKLRSKVKKLIAKFLSAQIQSVHQIKKSLTGQCIDYGVRSATGLETEILADSGRIISDWPCGS